MKRGTLGLCAVLVLSLTTPARTATAAGPSIPQVKECPPTPGVLAIDDIDRGRCLFHSTKVFGQDDRGPFASCAICHYGQGKSDRGVHLVQITNAAGHTEQVLRKTPSLLKASADFPYGADGRFATIQEAAHAAILSPVEMRGTTVTNDQLDALAAFILALPDSESVPAPVTPALSPGVLRLIALGKTVFFGNGTCFTCHAGPDFTNHRITTDAVNLTFTGTTDRGAQFVGTGGPMEFKVPSLLFLDADAPFMHNGALARLVQVTHFYNESLALNLTLSQLTGLEYWLRNCLDPRRTPRPSSC
jgi:cytochrome c peroxidase